MGTPSQQNMTKAVALIAFALCILAIAGNVQGQINKDIKVSKFYTNPDFKYSVEGAVFCATRSGNAGTIVKQMVAKGEGEVEIKCKSRKNGTVTLIQPVIVDNGGYWTTNMENSHENDICTVAVVHSPDPLCNVKVPGFRGATINQSDYEDKDSGRRIFYVKKEFGYLDNKALPNCRKVKSKRGKLTPAVTLQ